MNLKCPNVNSPAPTLLNKTMFSRTFRIKKLKLNKKTIKKTNVFLIPGIKIYQNYTTFSKFFAIVVLMKNFR